MKKLIVISAGVLTAMVILSAGCEIFDSTGKDSLNSDRDSTGNAGELAFSRTFGGSDRERGTSVANTSDGGFVIAGWTHSDDGFFTGLNQGETDIFLIRTDSEGNPVWTQTWGGSSTEEAHSVAATPDGGFVMTGWSRSNDGDFFGVKKGEFDTFLIKADAGGDTEWIKTWGGSLSTAGWKVSVAGDGGYIIAGWTRSNDGDFYGQNNGFRDVFLIKTDSSGNTEWTKTFGGSRDDIGFSVTPQPDGGFVTTGWTVSEDGDFSGLERGYRDLFAIKTDSEGNELWTQSYGGSRDDIGAPVASTPDGGFLMTGYTDSNDGDFTDLKKGTTDIFLIKADPNGKTEWVKIYGGNFTDSGWSVAVTSDGGSLITGSAESNNEDFSGLNKGEADILTIKTSPSGSTEWIKTWGGSGLDQGNSVTPASDGGVVVTGWTDSADGDFARAVKEHEDIFLIKVKP